MAAGPGAADRPLAWDRWDSLIVAIVVLASSLAHPFDLILDRPYWFDETWVAALTRMSLTRAVQLSSSTPTGWAALVWLVHGSADQRGRLLVLGFSMATAGAAYVLARGLPWNRRSTARLLAIGVAAFVACVPIALLRNDLKQYTADAFFALVLLAVTRYVDRETDPPSIAWLGGAALVSLPFSTTSAFVSAACFAGLLVAALRRRDRKRIVSTLCAGTIVAIVGLLFFVVAVLPRVNAGLTNFWSGFFLTGGPVTMIGDTWTRLSDLSTLLAMPAWLFVALFALGVFALVRMGATAVAVAVLVLWLEMAIAGRLQKYPFLDQRTFHFVLVVTVAVGGIGAAWLVVESVKQTRVGGAFLVIGATVLFISGITPSWHQLGLPEEDVRGQVDYVAQTALPTDVILVNYGGDFGFAYYWPRGGVSASRSGGILGFIMNVSGQRVVVTGSTQPTSIRSALKEALKLQALSGPTSRIFIVLTHVLAPEHAAWIDAFSTLGVRFRRVPTDGREPVRIVDPPR